MKAGNLKKTYRNGWKQVCLRYDTKDTKETTSSTFQDMTIQAPTSQCALPIPRSVYSG